MRFHRESKAGRGISFLLDLDSITFVFGFVFQWKTPYGPWVLILSFGPFSLALHGVSPEWTMLEHDEFGDHTFDPDNDAGGVPE